MFTCAGIHQQSLQFLENQSLHCYRRIDVNDLTTEKVTMKYSDTKWHDNHISSQLQASSTKRKIYNKSISSSHFFQSHPNTLPHPPPSQPSQPIAALMVSVITTQNCPINTPPSPTHLPNPLPSQVPQRTGRLPLNGLVLRWR